MGQTWFVGVFMFASVCSIAFFHYLRDRRLAHMFVQGPSCRSKRIETHPTGLVKLNVLDVRFLQQKHLDEF